MSGFWMKSLEREDPDFDTQSGFFINCAHFVPSAKYTAEERYSIFQDLTLPPAHAKFASCRVRSFEYCPKDCE